MFIEAAALYTNYTLKSFIKIPFGVKNLYLIFTEMERVKAPENPCFDWNEHIHVHFYKLLAFECRGTTLYFFSLLVDFRG